jgi:pimeloyl-ACP methyl ester carboxylesterase
MKSLYQSHIHKLLLPNYKDIAYTEVGTGNTTLIFIHGLANYLPVWNKNVTELSKKYKCIAIDLPGNGLSSRQTHYKYKIGFYANAVQEFIIAKKLKNVILIGHSMGGQVATLVAIQTPNLIAKLVLCATAGLEKFSTMEKSLFKNMLWVGDLVNADETYLSTTIKNSFFNFTNQGQEIIDELTSLIGTSHRSEYKRMVNESIMAILNEPNHELLSQINCPVLSIFGEADAMIPNKILHPLMVPKQIADYAATHIKNNEMHLLKKCGHFFHFEQAEQVNALIIKFLDK